MIEICGKQFDEDTIRSINITKTNILLDCDEDFYDLRYTDESQIREAIDWLSFKDISEEEINRTIRILYMVCKYHINRTEQCGNCPLQRNYGCVLQKVPAEWR